MKLIDFLLWPFRRHYRIIDVSDPYRNNFHIEKWEWWDCKWEWTWEDFGTLEEAIAALDKKIAGLKPAPVNVVYKRTVK